MKNGELEPGQVVSWIQYYGPNEHEALVIYDTILKLIQEPSLSVFQKSFRDRTGTHSLKVRITDVSKISHDDVIKGMIMYSLSVKGVIE